MNNKTTELTLTLQLAFELMDDVGMKGKVKNLANLLKQELEKKVIENYNHLYQGDPEIVINIMNSKHRLISRIADLDETDATLLSEVVEDFIKNIEEIRKTRPAYFTKLL